MSGFIEFNGIQPEQLEKSLPDEKTGKLLLAGAIFTALIITGIAIAGFTINF